MRLTPLDIKKQEFKRTLRGYDPIEVEAFLEVVADEYESAIREKSQLTDEVLKLRTQLKDYQQVEKTLKDTLVNAQDNLNSSRQNTKREADLILRDAEMKAEQIIEGARTKLERLKNDITIIRAQKESFARRLRHLLESQMELIGVLELDDSGYDNDADKDLTGSDTSLRKVNIPSKKGQGQSNNENSHGANNDRATDSGEAKKTPRISDQYLT